MIKIFILIIFLIFLLIPPYAKGTDPIKFPVKSYKNLDVKEFNLQLANAEKNKEDRLQDPLHIAMHFHKISALRFVNINQKSDRAECPLKSVITIVEEGFLDDQMRGKWVQFYLERKECTKPWRVKEAREAYLCGLPSSDLVFLKRLCQDKK